MGFTRQDARKALKFTQDVNTSVTLLLERIHGEGDPLTHMSDSEEEE